MVLVAAWEEEGAQQPSFTLRVRTGRVGGDLLSGETGAGMRRELVIRSQGSGGRETAAEHLPCLG